MIQTFAKKLLMHETAERVLAPGTLTLRYACTETLPLLTLLLVGLWRFLARGHKTKGQLISKANCKLFI